VLSGCIFHSFKLKMFNFRERHPPHKPYSTAYPPISAQRQADHLCPDVNRVRVLGGSLVSGPVCDVPRVRARYRHSTQGGARGRTTGKKARGGLLAVTRSLSSCSIVLALLDRATLALASLPGYPGASWPVRHLPTPWLHYGPAPEGVSFLHTGASGCMLRPLPTKRTTRGRPNAGFPFIPALALSASCTRAQHRHQGSRVVTLFRIHLQRQLHRAAEEGGNGLIPPRQK